MKIPNVYVTNELTPVENRQYRQQARQGEEYHLFRVHPLQLPFRLSPPERRLSCRLSVDTPWQSPH